MRRMIAAGPPANRPPHIEFARVWDWGAPEFDGLGRAPRPAAVNAGRRVEEKRD